MSEQPTPPAGDEPNAEPTISTDELAARLEALEGMKDKAVGESKAEREKRKALESRLAQFEEAEKKRAEKAARDAGEFDKLKAEMEAETKVLRGKLEGTLKTVALTNAMAAANIAAPYRSAVEAMFKSKAKVDSDETVTLNDKSVVDAIKEWAATDEGKAFVAAPANNGGGANGGSGDPNKKQITRTEFDKLSQFDRSKFAREGGKVVDA